MLRQEICKRCFIQLKLTNYYAKDVILMNQVSIGMKFSHYCNLFNYLLMLYRTAQITNTNYKDKRIKYYSPDGLSVTCTDSQTYTISLLKMHNEGLMHSFKLYILLLKSRLLH